MSKYQSFRALKLVQALGFASIFGFSVQALAETKTLTNASYDVSRELYEEINPAFVKAWKAQKNEDVNVVQSHGGSSKQALAVISGLEADVVTMNQAPDIDAIAEKGLLDKDWRKRFPNEASPYTTTTVFLVRKGNPKAIKDWEDLTQAGLQVIVPNPKTSGNGRYTYLAAYGYGLDKTKTEEGAKEFVTKLFANVPVLDGGGRGATTTFTQRDIGDVLVTFENEAALISKEVGADKFEVVYPSLSIDASAPIAVVDSIAQKRNTTDLAKAYLDFLYTPEAQAIIAKHHLRPRDAKVLEANAKDFPAIKVFTVEDKLGGWKTVKNVHFKDGGLLDQVLIKKTP
ncbi:sulfate ABC transporter substrate-binding protein [uncultured Thiothrix sp.]|uniref:sulfate ABC transporter substrate-binding protein n=1 Tax=uncultured Thiothrix sp. TaxID=223185 RepID=UPI002613F201|nr:sulfate ABC transporter substrate-binding protein [uncultured Thiothrix sp.]